MGKRRCQTQVARGPNRYKSTGTKQGKRVGGKARAKAEQEAAETWFCPSGVRLALSDPDRFERFFTPFQWQVLRARWWHRIGPPVSSVMVGRALGMTGESGKVRKAEDGAKTTAGKLLEWEHANRKWHHIRSLKAAGWTPEEYKRETGRRFPRLDDYEREALRWYRSASQRAKKGRREQAPVTVMPAPKQPFKVAGDDVGSRKYLEA